MKSLSSVRRWFKLGNAGTPVGPCAAGRAVPHPDQPGPGALRRADREQHQHRLCAAVVASLVAAVRRAGCAARRSAWSGWSIGRRCAAGAEPRGRRSSICARPASSPPRSTRPSRSGRWRCSTASTTNSRAPVALLVFMGSVGSAYCLASFPSAARLTLLRLRAADLAAAPGLRRSAAGLHRDQSLRAARAAHPHDEHELPRSREAGCVAREDCAPSGSARGAPKPPRCDRAGAKPTRSPPASTPRSTTCRTGSASSTASSG